MSTDEPKQSKAPNDGLPHDATDEDAGRSNRVMRFARRLMDRKELAEDTRELLWTMVATSDKAKNEAVRIAAKEVRNYLSELKLKDDILELATSHSLEISVSLKPLPHMVKAVEQARAEAEAEAMAVAEALEEDNGEAG